jgi:hypothetical protein
MFRLKSSKANVAFECEGSLSFSILEPETIQLNLKLLSPGRVPVAPDYKASVAVASEWLSMKVDTLPMNDFRKLHGLEIRDDGPAATFAGPYQEGFFVSDEGGGAAFVYYVDQYLDPSHSWTRLEYVGGSRLRAQHRSSLDFSYELDIDTEVDFEGVCLYVYKFDDPDIERREKELLSLFHSRFETSDYAKPLVKDRNSGRLYHFKPVV